MPCKTSCRPAVIEHCSNIFKGAFWAWPHLGVVTPYDLLMKATAAIDLLTFPLADNARLRAATKKEKGAKIHDDNTGATGDGNPAKDRVGGALLTDPGHYPQ